MIEGILLFAELALFAALLLAVRRMARKDSKSNMGIFSYRESTPATDKATTGKPGAGGRRA